MISKNPNIVNMFSSKKFQYFNLPLNNYMTFNEKDALLLYLESRLLDLCTHMEQFHGACNVGLLYDGVYDILVDMEQTLETQIELEHAEKSKKST